MFFPFCIDVEKMNGIIIGGGNIALEKVEKLAGFNARITLLSKSICEEIKKYSDKVVLIQKEYEEKFLDGFDYVIVATNDKEINRQIYQDAKKKKLFVNVVDVPEMCDFIFPSVIQKGKLVVGVSTSGAGPQVAIRIRKQIENIVPDNIEEILDYLARERIKAKETIPDSGQRRKYLIELADSLLKKQKDT